MSDPQVDPRDHRRPPVTRPGYLRGRPPRSKGRRYPADPPRVEEIVWVMRAAGEKPYGHRLRGLIVVMWRTGLRISEALGLNEASSPDEGRSWSATARAASAVRSGWTSGDGSRSAPGSSFGYRFLPVRSSA